MSPGRLPEEVSETRTELGVLAAPFEKLVTYTDTSGVVRLYFDHGLGIKVVGKRVDTLDRPLVDRLAEPQLQASLNHPNLARVLSAGEVLAGPQEMRPIIEIVTPFYPEGSVHQHVVDQAGEGVSCTRTVMVAAAVCRGLAEMHDSGFVHRDIKSSNVFLTDDQHVAVVGDLGEAAPLSDGAAEGIDTAHPWTAPEQVALGSASSRSDLYGLGITMAEMLRGGFDYAGYDLLKGRRRLERGHRALPPGELRLPPTADASIRALVGKLTANDPFARPASAHKVLAALARAQPVDWEQTHNTPQAKRWEAAPVGSRITVAVEAAWRPRLKVWELVGKRRLRSWQAKWGPLKAQSLRDSAVYELFDTVGRAATNSAR